MARPNTFGTNVLVDTKHLAGELNTWPLISPHEADIRVQATLGNI